LRQQWFYRLHGVFGYTTDTLVALSGIGITIPLFQVFAAGDSNSGPGNAAGDVSTTLAGLPTAVYFLLLTFIVCWVLLRVGFNREEGQKRAVLARSCIQSMKQAEAKLHRLLLKADPMPDLTALVNEVIAPTVDRNVQEGAWVWPGPDPTSDSEVELQLRVFCQKYEGNWSPVSPIEIRVGVHHG
jgi:hypothetical protein